MSNFGDLGPLISGHQSYSLEGDDRIALSLLRSYVHSFGKEEIFYLDIGCNDPIAGNNSFLFYQLGFRGVCIDPLSQHKHTFRNVRPRDNFINAAVSPISRTVKLTVFDDATASSCDYATVARYTEKFKVEGEMLIEALSIDEILAAIAPNKILTIPLVSIDIEGGEYAVIESMLCYSAHKYELIVVEDKLFNLNSFDHRSAAPLYSLMLSHGYTLISKTPLNSFYLRRESSYFQWLPSAMF